MKTKESVVVSTLGELRAALADLPDDTLVSAAGEDMAALHFRQDEDREEYVVVDSPETAYNDEDE